ncbi:hypothetical protein J4732_18340 [Serratia marcescens]|uniref:Uncharacterized protein n=1 Tax=Serratia marcescens TaxID=615 RepID=A0A939SRE5_SERMA|nr:hypothetical protein [Serratia marcescens]
MHISILNAQEQLRVRRRRWRDSVLLKQALAGTIAPDAVFDSCWRRTSTPTAASNPACMCRPEPLGA